MQVPNVAVPRGGVDVQSFDLKRARIGISAPGSYTTVAGTGVPAPFASIGTGEHATSPYINVSIPVTYLLVPFDENRWTQEIPMNAPLFIKRQHDVLAKKSRSDDALRAVGVTLPILHFLIHKRTLEEPGEWGPDRVAREWVLSGMLGTHPALPWGQGGTALPPGPVNSERPVIVLPYTGPEEGRALNVWGNVYGNQHLWFVLKEMPVTAERTYVTDLAGLSVEQPGIYPQKSPDPIRYMTTLVPVATDSRTIIPMADLTYVKDGETHVGVAWYVGLVGRNRSFAPLAKASDFKPDLTNTGPLFSMQALARCRTVETGLECSN